VERDDRALRWVTDADGKRVGPLHGRGGRQCRYRRLRPVDGPPTCSASTRRRDDDPAEGRGVIAGRIESPTRLGGHPIEVRFRRRSTPGTGTRATRRG
jgi:hypothetical protein